MHHPTDRIAHTSVFVTPVVEHWLEQEIAQWVHPMKDRSDDPSHHERMLLPRSYISLLGRINPTTHRTMSERSYHGATYRSPLIKASRPSWVYQECHEVIAASVQIEQMVWNPEHMLENANDQICLALGALRLAGYYDSEGP